MANIQDFEKFTTPFVSIDFNGIIVTVKKYISQVSKIIIAHSIRDFVFADNGVESDSDVNSKDFKNILYIWYLINEYTDLELGEDNNYHVVADLAVTSGFYDKLIMTIPMSERSLLMDEIDRCIEDKCREIQEANSIQKQLEKFLSTVLQKIPDKQGMMDLLKKAKKEFKNFDLSKLDMVNGLLKETGGKEVKIPDGKVIDNVVDMVEKIK